MRIKNDGCLTNEERDRLGELWTANEEWMRWRIRRETYADEILGIFAAQISRPVIFRKLAPDYTNDGFLRMANCGLKYAGLKLYRERSHFQRLIQRLRQVKPGFTPADRTAETSEAKIWVSRQLTERQSQAVIGQFWYGFSATENSHRFGVSPQAAQKRVQESFKKLRPKLMYRDLRPV